MTAAIVGEHEQKKKHTEREKEMYDAEHRMQYHMIQSFANVQNS